MMSKMTTFHQVAESHIFKTRTKKIPGTNCVAAYLEHGVDGRGGGAVEGREGDGVVAAVLEQLEQVGPGHHAGGNNALQTHLGGKIRLELK